MLEQVVYKIVGKSEFYIFENEGEYTWAYMIMALERVEEEQGI